MCKTHRKRKISFSSCSRSNALWKSVVFASCFRFPVHYRKCSSFSVNPNCTFSISLRKHFVEKQEKEEKRESKKFSNRVWPIHLTIFNIIHVTNVLCIRKSALFAKEPIRIVRAHTIQTIIQTEHNIGNGAFSLRTSSVFTFNIHPKVFIILFLWIWSFICWTWNKSELNSF